MSELHRQRYDVAIIGGGIYGLVVGYHLARAGRDAVVLERGRIGGEASSANAGSIGVQNKPLRMQEETVLAAEEWSTLSDALGADVGYERIGGMRIGHSDDDVALLQQHQPQQREAGVPVEFLDTDALRGRAPYLARSVRAASFCALDGLSNPLATNLAFARAGQSLGMELREQCTVVDLVRADGGVRIETDGGALWASSLVIAAGAWSSGFAAMLGVGLPLTWAVNTVTITAPGKELIPHMVTHVRGNLTVKQHDGRVLIGGAWRGDGHPYGGSSSVNLESLRGNLAWACNAIPGLKDFKMLRSWSGIQANTPDRKFLMGPILEEPSVTVFTGGSGGYTLAPYLGRLMAEWVDTGTMPAGAAAMDVRRFLHGRSTDGGEALQPPTTARTVDKEGGA